jgi:hypothetical protein
VTLEKNGKSPVVICSRDSFLRSCADLLLLLLMEAAEFLREGGNRRGVVTIRSRSLSQGLADLTTCEATIRSSEKAESWLECRCHDRNAQKKAGPPFVRWYLGNRCMDSVGLRKKIRKVCRRADILAKEANLLS